VNLVNWECSPIGANGDQGSTCRGTLKGVNLDRGPSNWRGLGPWWTGDMFTKEGVFGLIPPHLRLRAWGSQGGSYWTSRARTRSGMAAGEGVHPVGQGFA